MKSSIVEIEPILGTPMGDGFYAGRIREGDQVFALIVAPKALGEISMFWNSSDRPVVGAASYTDGMANTKAMAEAGSDLAKRVLSLKIGDSSDWYIPAQDELEITYRNLKPTSDSNWQYARSGINLAAVTPTRPYTPDVPAQTCAESFQAGGAEAFEPEWYWTSMQHAGYATNAWGQYFDDGGQVNIRKSFAGRARAFRRLPI